MRTSRVEWVADDGMCRSAGCTLPRGHRGSCRPEILSGKRERKPSVKVKEGPADVEEVDAVEDAIVGTMEPNINI